MGSKLRWGRPRGAKHPGWAEEHDPPKERKPKAPLDFIPFGKFKGTKFNALPWSYLGWLMEQDWVQPEMASLLRWEIARRLGLDR